jgi:hypothetical protein
MPTIEVKFGQGQKVYFIKIKSDQKEEMCEVCEGLGKIKDWLPCPNPYCMEGKKTRHYNDCYKIDKEFKIERIHIQPKGKIWYVFADASHGTYEENLFSTEEEALKECERRNKEENLPNNEYKFYRQFRVMPRLHWEA